MKEAETRVKEAMEETLTEITREWMERWVEQNEPAILCLPMSEGNLVLRAPYLVSYTNLELSGPAGLILALRRLEYGTETVPTTRVLTKLQKYLEPYILKPDALNKL